ncbi:hypothetical protein ECE50_000690 [Chitinophaga sp. Mgbs1]|uniref:Uncharacterized protein n=1 Tax=Chitinophaga solisilvae TaxID=1233460 RepID=A0A433WJI8_9BACT|nr:hypothetical protein [Chitinophaga solisilvae]
MRKIISALTVLAVVCSTGMAQSLRWQLTPERTIRWKVQPGPAHRDHIEMSGRQLSGIITYGADDKGLLVLHKQLVFPMLRTVPNNTHASLRTTFDSTAIPAAAAGGVPLQLYPVAVELDGVLQITSRSNSDITVKDILYPSVDKPVFIQWRQFENRGSSACTLQLDSLSVERYTAAEKGVYGVYLITATGSRAGTFRLQPGEKLEVAYMYSARVVSAPSAYYSAAYELQRRRMFVQSLQENLVLETPDDTLNEGFSFAKIRAAESIYDTRGGLMHGPGGGAYYAAIWANDQAEYANPFFPFLGDAAGNESATNSFRLFATYMNDRYKPIPSSIIAEGAGIWNGAGDRGDQAMIAYGAARYALASGDTAVAQQLYPLIQWCLRYLEGKRRPDGIITSDSDELEGRFPAGKANLSTNSLAYGAYESAACLAAALGHKDTAAAWEQSARVLADAIERYFGHRVQGFDTYRYYEENTILRSWICLPLSMGIFTRRDATIQALLSPALWSPNGVLTAAGDHTFWDRSTLYALRGMFFAGATDTALSAFAYYTRQRLLGEHVPYPVEAWPEGNQRHLSAESALYCRTVTEGLFGIVPTGLRQFTMRPRLPARWNHMALRHIRAFQSDLDISVKRQGKSFLITVTNKRKEIYRSAWNGKDIITIKI